MTTSTKPRPRSARRRIARSLFATTVLTATVVASGVTAPHAVASGQTLQVWLTTSDGANKITAQPNITLGPVSSGSINVSVNDSLKSQSFTGLGPALTDSSAYLLTNLKNNNPSAYSSLMSSLFTTTPSDGIGLSVVRVPMGSTDFISAGNYWTDDDNPPGGSDPNMQYFGLHNEETSYTIPRLKDALAQNSGVQTVASPWTAPAWMKSNGQLVGATCGLFGCNIGQLNSSAYQAWANYFTKWIQAYQAQGVTINAITPQNEPLNAPDNYPAMYWDESPQSNWIHNYLAPTLRSANLSPEGLGYDHNWDNEYFPQNQLGETQYPAGNDLGGIAWHCYKSGSASNTFEPAEMTRVHNLYPSKDVYETECSTPWGYNNAGSGDPNNQDPGLSPRTVLLSLQNWAKGAMLWNLALDQNHGPTGPNVNPCNGSTCNLGLVSVNTTNWTVTKNNVYYQLGQISRFVQRNATHIASSVSAHGVDTVAYQNPGGQEVLVAHNTNSSATTFTTTWNGQGSFSYTLPAGATATFTGTIPAAPVLSSTPSAGHVYRLSNKTSGKPTDLMAGKDPNADGTQIVGQTDSGDTTQQWRLVAVGNGSYNLIDAYSGKALDNTGSNSNNVQMQQWTITGTGNANQQWWLNQQSDGYYTITNAGNGLALDLKDGNLSDQTAIQQYSATSGDANQEWSFVPIS